MADQDLQTTALRLKLGPLIESAQADLAQLHALQTAHGDELWHSSVDAEETGKALARAIRMHEVNLEDAAEMVLGGYRDTVEFRKSAVALMQALGKIEASEFEQRIEKVKPVAPKPKEIVIRLDKDYYKQLAKERAMQEETKTEAPKLTEAEIQALEVEKAALSRMLKAREPRRETSVPVALDVKPSVPRHEREPVDPAAVILAEQELARLEDQVRAEDAEYRKNAEDAKKAGVTRRALLIAQRDAAAGAVRDAREAAEAESLAESVSRREEDQQEADRQERAENEAHLVEVRLQIRPLLERGQIALREMRAIFSQHGDSLKRMGELSWTAIPGNWPAPHRIEYGEKIANVARTLYDQIKAWIEDCATRVLPEAETLLSKPWQAGPDYALRVNTIAKGLTQLDGPPAYYKKTIQDLAWRARDIERKAGIVRKPTVEITINIDKDKARPLISEQMKEDILAKGAGRALGKTQQASGIQADDLFE